MLLFIGLSAECLFSQQADTKNNTKMFALEFQPQLPVILTITQQPVLHTAFLQYEILPAIAFSCMLQSLPSKSDTSSLNSGLSANHVNSSAKLTFSWESFCS